MNADGLYSIAAPSDDEMAAYHERVSEVGLFEAAAEAVREHARRLMAGSRVGVVEVPRVVDLDAERARRRT